MMTNNILSLDELKLALHIHGSSIPCVNCPLWGKKHCDRILAYSALFHIDKLQ